MLVTCDLDHWRVEKWEICLYVGMLKSVAVSIVGARLDYIESRNSLSVLTPEPSSIFSCPFKRSCELLRPVRIGVLQRSASGPPSSELTEINRYCGHLPARLTWPYLALPCYASHGNASIHQECHTGDTCYLYAHLLSFLPVERWDVRLDQTSETTSSNKSHCQILTKAVTIQGL